MRRAIAPTLLLAMLGCAAGVPPVAESPGPAARVARGPVPVLPRPRSVARSDDGVVGLQVSNLRVDAADLVARFFDAVRRESLRDLGELMSEDSTLESGLGGTSQAAAKVWAARFKRLDYRHPPGRGPYRVGDVGLFSAEDLDQLGEERTFHLSPGPEELLAVVEPRGIDSAAGPRHFGRRLEFVLGPGESGLKIRRLFEEFRLP